MAITIVSHKELKHCPQHGYQVMYVGPSADKINPTQHVTHDHQLVDNIADKNPYYCELTALYALWKTGEALPDKSVGLVHYRRRFIDAKPTAYRFFEWISRTDGLRNLARNWFFRHEIRYQKAEEILSSGKYDIILPQPERLKYSVAKHYAKLHYMNDLEIVRNIIRERYPDYLFAFDVCIHDNECSPYNMFISRQAVLNQYAPWIFDILSHAEQLISVEGRTKNQARVFGFLAERLFNVYVLKNKLRIKHMPVFLFRRE